MPSASFSGTSTSTSTSRSLMRASTVSCRHGRSKKRRRHPGGAGRGPLEGGWMTTLLQDMRHGLRVLWKSPGFTSVAVLSLALGVGANTAIFSIVNAVLLRSLPLSHPERLVKIVASHRGVGARDIGLSVPEFDDLRSRAGVFDQVDDHLGAEQCAGVVR